VFGLEVDDESGDGGAEHHYLDHRGALSGVEIKQEHDDDDLDEATSDAARNGQHTEYAQGKETEHVQPVGLH